jgi:hypothetical protein
MCSAAIGGGPYYSPDAQKYVFHMSLHGTLKLEGSPSLMLTGQKNVLVVGPSELSCHGEGPITHLMPRCTSFTCCCMMLHGALMLEGLPTLMQTGQKVVLVEGPSVLSCHWGGPYYSPDAPMYVLHMSLHGALMLDGSPTLMWTMPENVLVLDPSVLNNGNQREGHTSDLLTPAKGRPYYCPYAKM